MWSQYLFFTTLVAIVDAQVIDTNKKPPPATCIIQGDCVAGDKGLTWLSKQLTPSSVISCRGSPLQLYNAGRYWGEQYGKNASVVVFPVTAQDVSYSVQATSKTPLGDDYAFVCGAHSQTNASSSYGFVIDLSYMNTTEIIQNFKIDGSNQEVTAIAYQGGATSEQVTLATQNSGYTAITARISNVGMGGFSTGGGVGFLAGPYGFAIDRLVAADVVLPGSGKFVTATASNQYSDLFWAMRGGGGQFGIVTTFYQKAAPEPKVVGLSLYMINDTSEATSRSQVVDFYNQNKDPFSLIYYIKAFLPANPLASNPAPTDFGVRTALVTVWFDNPLDANQPSANATFAELTAGLKYDYEYHFDVNYLELYGLIDSFFPYGFRRGFWGPQTTNISTSYLASAASTFATYISASLKAGEFPASALWCIQYMSPGLNGNLPKSNADTSWPHAVAGHQTLFSPAWQNAADDGLQVKTNDQFNILTWSQQVIASKQSKGAVPPVIFDYANYIASNDAGSRVWGDNVPRLNQIKQKYDPQCTIHNGKVFASKGCIKGGWANIFANGQNGH